VGSTIITTVFQIILNVTVHGFPMQGAVNAGRFHHQWKPDWILSETGALGFGTGLRLWLKGHKIAPKKAVLAGRRVFWFYRMAGWKAGPNPGAMMPPLVIRVMASD
jgi:gamma-glutamyltranspeptidase